jgi:type II secretory pathway pseudopilin PulG
MKTKLFIVSILIVSMFAVSACGAVSGLKSASSTADAFMQALKDQANDTSWNMLNQDIQTEIGDKAAWADFTQPRAFDSWKFTSNSIENDRAQLDGEAKLGTDTYTVTLIMDSSGDSWLVSGINFTFKE